MIKFSCNSANLQKAVSVVEKAISSRTTLPIMENLFFELSENQLRLRGNDLEVSIECKMPVENASGSGSFLAKASTVSSIVSKMTGQQLAVSVDEKNKVMLHSEHVGFDILGHSSEEYPAFPDVETGTKINLKASELRTLIKYTIFAVSFDETKQFLNGVLVKSEDQYLTFVATDGFRLSLKRQKLEKSISNLSVIVPYKAMNELSRILQQVDQDQNVEINVAGNQISFVLPNFVLISRLIQGQFPDYKQVLPKASQNSFSVPRRTLVSACERASIIASETNNVVRFTFGNVKIRVKASAPKMGEFKEEIEVRRVTGSDEKKVSFNVKLVLDAIKNIETDDVTMEFNSELSPCVVKPVNDEDYVYIIMPIRTSDYENEVEAVATAR